MTSRRRKSLWAVLVVVVLALPGLGWIAYMASPTSGKPIERYPSPKAALLLIDLQEDCTGTTATPPFPYKNAAELIAQSNQAIRAAEARKDLVVVVDQEFRGTLGTLWSRLFVGGRLMAGEKGTETDHRLAVSAAARFSKPKGDAFSNPEFGRFLVEHQVDELFIAGVDAQFCVQLTARGALARGYRVNVLRDAIGLMQEDKWADVLSDYEKRGIRVITVADYFLGATAASKVTSNSQTSSSKPF
jgi:nicotinamidase/pyrazinamidase